MLTDSDGELLAFGYEAEDRYSQAVEEEEEEGTPDDLLLFRHFKMILHTREVTQQKQFSVDTARRQF